MPRHTGYFQSRLTNLGMTNKHRLNTVGDFSELIDYQKQNSDLSNNINPYVDFINQNHMLEVLNNIDTDLDINNNEIYNGVNQNPDKNIQHEKKYCESSSQTETLKCEKCAISTFSTFIYP